MLALSRASQLIRWPLVGKHMDIEDNSNDKELRKEFILAEYEALREFRRGRFFNHAILTFSFKSDLRLFNSSMPIY